MGKRSSFERVPRDFYPTPSHAVQPLLPFLPRGFLYAEPCVGDGALVAALQDRTCVYAADIAQGQNALDYDGDYNGAQGIITNPPWDRSILHPMIEKFRNSLPTFLLFDADWMHTRQAEPYIKYCSLIVSVGRVKWIPESKHTGKDNCCWYLFEKEKTTTIFVGRSSNL